MSLEQSTKANLMPELISDALDQLSRVNEQATLKCRVASNSMAPALIVGDRVLLKKLTIDRLRVGDIIAYRRQNQVVVHRLLYKGNNWLLTKGDCHLSPDPPVLNSDYIGCVHGTGRSIRHALRRLQQVVHLGHAFTSSSAPRFDWSQKWLTSCCFAGIPVQIMLPISLHQSAILERYRSDWGAVSTFGGWLVDVSYGYRCRGKGIDKSPTLYQLQIFSESNANHYQVEGDLFCASIDRRRKMVHLVVDETDASGSLENLLRVLLSIVLVHGTKDISDGLLVHASGIVVAGKAYLCYGPSGSGKSTLAALARNKGYQVLSDDIVMMCKRGENFYLQGVPFQGSHEQATCSPGMFPLAGVLKLFKHDRPLNIKYSGATSLASLMAVLPFVSQDKLLTALALEKLENWLPMLPIRKLYFKPDHSVWSSI